MAVGGIDRGVKVVVEKLECFGVDCEERAGGQDAMGKMGGIKGEVKWLWGSWLLFSMMVLEWQAMRRRRYFRR